MVNLIPGYARAATNDAAWRYAAILIGNLMLFISTKFLARNNHQFNFGINGLSGSKKNMADLMRDPDYAASFPQIPQNSIILELESAISASLEIM